MVKIKDFGIRKIVLAASYLYLALPVMIFFLGWCRWYIGIPAALALSVSLWLCLKEHQEKNKVQYTVTSLHWIKAAAVLLVVLIWAGMAGIGGYAWQNADHPVRNELFVLLVEEKWPVARQFLNSSGYEIRGMVYYIGYWFPAALAGKWFGISAGWMAQYLWAVAGILLMYAVVCIWRQKLTVWPLFLIIFFSGLDAFGMLLFSREGLEVFGEVHIEPWPPYYQYSSMTTQLFWVFNQAVPAWLLAALIFLVEKPRNMVFLACLTILTSTFPFAGMLPYLLYFMVARCRWEQDYHKIWHLLKDCLKNWASFQNTVGAGVTALICGIYISGNNAVRASLPVLDSGHRAVIVLAGAVAAGAVLLTVVFLAIHGWGPLVWKAAFVLGVTAAVWRFGKLPYADWQSPLFYWMNLTLFYAVEAGVYLLVLYPYVKDKKLFIINSIWLYFIPLVVVGSSCDFCMRASIPGLFLVMLWCIHAVAGIRQKNAYRFWLLILLLAIGAVTPLHEIKRSFVNTREYYENQTADAENIFMGNNFSGSTKGFFWRYFAKPFL